MSSHRERVSRNDGEKNVGRNSQRPFQGKAGAPRAAGVARSYSFRLRNRWSQAKLSFPAACSSTNERGEQNGDENVWPGGRVLEILTRSRSWVIKIVIIKVIGSDGLFTRLSFMYVAEAADHPRTFFFGIEHGPTS